MLQLTDEDVLARMRIDNQWWRDEAAVQRLGPYIKRDYFESFYGLAVQTRPIRAVVLMGPRRVGKTVMIMQAVADLIAAGTPPQQIFYASLDTPVYNKIPLEKLLSIYQVGIGPDANKRVHVFYDEVQYLRDWERHLKSLVDSFPNIKFVVSGSAAAALKLKSDESGAGRFTDFVLPPLTFAEFLRLTRVEDSVIAAQDGQFAARDLKQLNAEFVRYLNYGGYPELATAAREKHDLERQIGSDIIDKVLLRDLPSLYGISDVQELNSLFTSLAFNTGNEVSLDNLASSSSVAKNTLRKYLEYLEAAYLVRRVERVDRTASRFQKAMTFKIYLTNPSLRAALFGRLEDDDPRFGFVAETAVLAQWMHSPHFATRFKYGRWQGKEVDIIHLNASLQMPQWAVEVKWSDRHVERPEEIIGLFDFAKAHPALSQLTATTRTASGPLLAYGARVQLEPTALYCYKVGKNIVKNLSELQ
jgi:uncharacterized protein